MVVGVGTMIFRLHGVYSLKEKRELLKIHDRKASEQFLIFQLPKSGANDMGKSRDRLFHDGEWQQGDQFKNGQRVFNMAEEMGLAEMTDSEMEIINFW